jgi:two-component system cell cycle sensor histidine kinase/response regulator CckA
MGVTSRLQPLESEDGAGNGPVKAEPLARRMERARAFSGFASLAVALLGTSVLVGWRIDQSHLKSGIPGLVAMNPVTALSFVVAGLALCLLRTESLPARTRLLARMLAVLVVVLPLVSLSRLYLPWDLALDRLFFSAQVAVASGGQPNRMAPNTGLNFVLLGLALLFLDRRTARGWRPAEGMTAAAGIFALIAVLGYAYESSLLYGVGAFIPMAVNTAVGFVLLSAGVLCARPGDGLMALFLADGPGGVLARRLVPSAFVIPAVLGWLALKGQMAGLFDGAGGLALMAAAITLTIATLIWLSAVSLDQSDRARVRAEQRVRRMNDELEARVVERTREVERVNEELRATFEASPLAICTVSTDSRVLSWNPAAEELFGWTAAEVLGRFPPFIPPDLMEELERLRQRVNSGAPLTNYETQRLHKDGRRLELSLSTASLFDKTGATCGVVAVYTNVGDRKALEAQLRQAQKMEAVGRLAGGVAHDFNNILTAIRAGAEFLLADLDAEDPRRTDAADIRSAADRAAGLTRQLLAFSRQQVLEPRVVDLNAVVTGIEPMLRRLVEENISFVTCLGADLNRVQADPNQLEQVLLNLVVNGRDAMPDGGTLLIETSNVVLDEEYPRTHATARPGPHVLLSVTDTGCGMDAATQARVFEPFFTTKPVGVGTGLGLATVYGIVKQSGGHIWVYSEVGSGTTFKIYFPRHTGPDDEAAPDEPRRSQPAAAASEATILLVEDDVAVRDVVSRLLGRHGYRVREVPNGAQALTTLADSSVAIDLVISDIVMPEMSGLELRERLRTIRPGLPLLLMSGYSQEAITRLGNPASLGPLVEKPFTVQGILEKVEQVLRSGAPDA